MIEAKTPDDSGKLVIEFEQERGFEHKMFKDEREKERELSIKQLWWWEPRVIQDRLKWAIY